MPDNLVGELRILNTKGEDYNCMCTCGRNIILSFDYLLEKDDCGCGHAVTIKNKKIITTNYLAESTIQQRRLIGLFCIKCEITDQVSYDIIKYSRLKFKCKCYRKTKEPKAPKYKPVFRDEFHEEWSKKVLARDRYKCVACGKYGYMNAHHLNGWNWFIAGRYDTNNGVSLCSGKLGCHNEFHRLYKRGNNTEEQFHEYLQVYHSKSLYEIKSKWNTR